MTRGGVNGWSHPNRGNLDLGLISDRLLLTLGASPGEDNLEWDKNNFQGQIGYAFFNSDANEAWVNVSAQIGNDGIPIVSASAPTAARTWTYNDVCRAGSRELRRPGSTTSAYVPVTLATTSASSPKRGTTSSIAAITAWKRWSVSHMRVRRIGQRESGSGHDRRAVRYMFNRTVGADFMYSKYTKFVFTDYLGNEHDITGSHSTRGT